MRTELVPHAYIVGPNSAGKSTVLEAIGLAELCLRTAVGFAPISQFTIKGDTGQVFLCRGARKPTKIPCAMTSEIKKRE